MKVDSSVEEQWSRACGEDNENWFFSVAETPDGGYIAGGLARLGWGDDLAYVVRFNSEGDTLWTKKWGTEGNAGDNVIRGITNAPSGGYFVVGQRPTPLFYGAYRLGEDGEILWTFDIGVGYSRPVLNSVLVTDEGGYMIAGYRGIYPGGVEFWLIRTAPDSTMLHNDVVLINPAFPSQFVAGEPFPNPFNNSVQISYTVPRPPQTSIRVYNQLEKQVAELYSDRLEEGDHSSQWNASGQAAGVYLCRLNSGGIDRTAKLLLVR